MKKEVTVSYPYFMVLLVIFVTLKLTGNITWSWLWVLSPLWIPWVVMIVIAVVVIIFVALKGR